MDSSANGHVAVRQRVSLELKGRSRARLGSSEDEEENLKATLAQASLALERSDPSSLIHTSWFTLPFQGISFHCFFMHANASQLFHVCVPSSRDQPRLRLAYPIPNSKFLGKSDSGANSLHQTHLVSPGSLLEGKQEFLRKDRV